MVIRADIEFNAGNKTFASGLLVELIAVLRRMRPGDLMAVVSSDPSLGVELEAWCRFTRNSLVDVAVEEAEADEFRQFLDSRRIDEQDRVIRRIALRGFATKGIALARADLVPEITITADGVYWHPVGAEDADLLVTPEIFPLADAFAAARRSWERERAHAHRLATIFNCA